MLNDGYIAELYLNLSSKATQSGDTDGVQDVNMNTKVASIHLSRLSVVEQI